MIHTEAVSGIDLLPTVLRTAGLSITADLPGHDLQDNSPRILFAESFPDTGFGRWNPRFNQTVRAVIEWPTKYIKATDGSKELYSMAADPRKHENIVLLHAVVARRFGAALDPLVHGSNIPSGSPAMNPAQLDRLRTLRYVR